MATVQGAYDMKAGGYWMQSYIDTECQPVYSDL